MITISKEFRDEDRRGVRRNVFLNNEPMGYIFKSDETKKESFDLNRGYEWSASAGGEFSSYYSEVGAIARVISRMSGHIAEAVLAEIDKKNDQP